MKRFGAILALVLAAGVFTGCLGNPCNPCAPNPCDPCRPNPCDPCRPNPCDPCAPQARPAPPPTGTAPAWGTACGGGGKSCG
jgi:hypothetical protein